MKRGPDVTYVYRQHIKFSNKKKRNYDSVAQSSLSVPRILHQVPTTPTSIGTVPTKAWANEKKSLRLFCHRWDLNLRPHCSPPTSLTIKPQLWMQQISHRQWRIKKRVSGRISYISWLFLLLCLVLFKRSEGSTRRTLRLLSNIPIVYKPQSTEIFDGQLQIWRCSVSSLWHQRVLTFVDGIWWKKKSAYYQITDFSKVPIWFPMFPLSSTFYQATAFWPTTKHSLSSINVNPKLIKECHVMRKMSRAKKMRANQLCWSVTTMTLMTKKVFQIVTKGGL